MLPRWVWVVMMVCIGLDFGLGVACLVLIPVGRPDRWLPPNSRGLYVAHAVFGGVLTLAALALVLLALDQSRFVRLGTRIGLVGLALGAAGGMMCAWHPWRPAGMGLMFAGGILAFFGYVVPLADTPQAEDLQASNSPRDLGA